MSVARHLEVAGVDGWDTSAGRAPCLGERTRPQLLTGEEYWPCVCASHKSETYAPLRQTDQIQILVRGLSPQCFWVVLVNEMRGSRSPARYASRLNVTDDVWASECW